MVRAVRSPGSTLKPFIYGMAFDELIVHPETIVVDRPMRFGDYAPENFDHFYRGELTAREALQLSLNLPAVALLDRIGPLRLTATLKRAGRAVAPARRGDSARPADRARRRRHNAGRSGHALCRDRRWRHGEAAALYTARGRADGRFRRAPHEPDRGLVSHAHPRGNAAAAQYRAAAAPEARAMHVAFKTGTSYGFRDAWAIGFDAAYTVGVWIGRPDGTFSPGRIGREAAAPVLYDVFDLLPAMAGPNGVANPVRPPEALLATNAAPAAGAAAVRRAAAALKSRSRRPTARGSPFRSMARRSSSQRRAGLQVAAAARRTAAGCRCSGWSMGRPVDSLPFRRKAEWLPDGAGAARITVIDAAGPGCQRGGLDQIGVVRRRRGLPDPARPSPSARASWSGGKGRQ